MMKKSVIAIALAMAVFATAIPVTTAAAEVPTDSTTEVTATTAEEHEAGLTEIYIPIEEGQALSDALAAVGQITVGDTLVTSATAETEGCLQATGDIPGGNDFTYIGVFETLDKRQIYVRIPYWYVNTYPETRWYFLTGDLLQARITVRPKIGTRGKKFVKKITLGFDSRLWLGGWGDYDNEMIVPGWIQAAFKEEATIVTTGTDPDLGDCTVVAIRAWKNKKAWARQKNPIVKVIHYVDYNHYRVTTTNQYSGNIGGGGTIIID